MRKILLGLVATAAIATPLMAMAPANAADGAQLIVNGDFSASADGHLAARSTTDFKWADPTVQGTWGNQAETMYDPGTYTIALQPARRPRAVGRLRRRGQRPDDDRQRVPEREPEGVVADRHPRALHHARLEDHLRLHRERDEHPARRRRRDGRREHLGHDQRHVDRLAGPDRRQPRQRRPVRRRPSRRLRRWRSPSGTTAPRTPATTSRSTTSR